MIDADPLLRNVAGSTRDRRPDEPVEVEDGLEVAIGRNVRLLRQQSGLSVGDTAAKIGISKAMMSKIENAQTSCSLSTLGALARGLDVPVTSLFRGAENEREAAYVAAGTGPIIARNGTREGHLYELLGALRGQHKRLEALLVTLTAESETLPLFQHPGTEFIYMLKGKMSYGHSRSVYQLAPGDSLLLDGEGQHGPLKLIRLPIRFLSVIAFPDTMQ